MEINYFLKMQINFLLTIVRKRKRTISVLLHVSGQISLWQLVHKNSNPG